MTPALTPELLLHAYQVGVFPMADAAEGGQIYWYAPDPRAILPLDAFHVGKNLRKLVRKERFEVTTDRDFRGVMHACARREETWISDEIIEAYCALHSAGFAHSVECWLEGQLVGGLYGVALGGAFFGESMFHHVRDASKVALVHLVQRLRDGGFALLDIQFITDHLARFGALEVSRDDYERRLDEALQVDARWTAMPCADVADPTDVSPTDANQTHER